MRPCLTSAARCAIKMCSREKDWPQVPSGKHISGRATGSFILSPTMQANYWMDATNDDPSMIC